MTTTAAVSAGCMAAGLGLMKANAMEDRVGPTSATQSVRRGSEVKRRLQKRSASRVSTAHHTCPVSRSARIVACMRTRWRRYIGCAKNRSASCASVVVSITTLREAKPTRGVASAEKGLNSRR
jgi:hypothetical protein